MVRFARSVCSRFSNSIFSLIQEMASNSGFHFRRTCRAGPGVIGVGQGSVQLLAASMAALTPWPMGGNGPAASPINTAPRRVARSTPASGRRGSRSAWRTRPRRPAREVEDPGAGPAR